MSSRGEPQGNLPADLGRRPRNWPLMVGLLLVCVILVIAVFGPSLAPRDPREHNLIIQVDETWMTPPYPAFTPGFPLGSDNLGRDLFSWLLWSVRPTMILVLVVASIRMTLGLLIGVVAGWSESWTGKAADVLISAALAVPALIGALIVITAIGFRLGVWAFVVGLSVTGWAETAQLVRERTRIVRGQDAVEASRALGASKAQTFLLHILPQVMPMIWMLLAFEISNTLVTTAGLGFLGYYLGGAVFTEVDDFVYQRISGMPELGQMLATAWMVLDEPWAMVAAGSVVFLIVLAFNLIGEGLQSRLTRSLGGARAFYLRAAGDVVPWLDDHVGAPLSALVGRRSLRGMRLALLSLCVLAVAGGVWVSRSRNRTGTETGGTAANANDSITIGGASSGAADGSLVSAFQVPGGHIWANEDHDPWRSRWVSFSGPMTTTVQWTYDLEGAFTGGPAIDADGMLYLAARAPSVSDGAPGMLVALDGEGQLRWDLDLADSPVGGPALGADGTVYVADKSGVTAVSPAGDPLWRFVSPDGSPATAGPMVAPDGTLYYKSSSALLAVGAEGSLLWQAPIAETAASSMPYLGADGETLYWGGLGFDRSDGSPADLMEPPTSEATAAIQAVVGADGRQYLRRDVQLLLAPVGTPSGTSAGTSGDDALQTDPLVFDLTEITWGADDAGVTPEGRPWMTGWPSIGGMGLGFYWGTAGGELSSKINIPAARNIQVLAADVNQLAYACMDSYETEPTCVALSPESDRPVWRLSLRGVDAIAGASLAPGRLYVATWEGRLLALGDVDSAGVTQAGPALSTVDAKTGVPVFGPEPLWRRPEVPGDHPWPMPRRDAWGTLWTDTAGPLLATERWVFEWEVGFSGGPVVAADDTVYVGTLTGSLLALKPGGELQWRASLPTGIVGSPAIGADGTIYVTDEGANLTALTPQGEELWRYHPTGVLTRTTLSSTGRVLKEELIALDRLGPAGAGPVVAPDGIVYYSMAADTVRRQNTVYFRSEVMVAVSPEGVGLLDQPPYVWSERLPARLSLDSSWVVWGNTLVAPTPSRLAQHASAAPYAAYVASRFEDNNSLALRVVTGADGRAYFVEGRSLTTWYLTPNALVLDRTFEWNPEDSPGTAADGGATPDGVRWLSFRNGTFVWITPEGIVEGPVRFPLESMLIGLDGNATAYGCGSSLGRPPECMAFALQSYTQTGHDAEPLWRVSLVQGDEVLGGALASDVVYVTTNAESVDQRGVGRLYALGGQR